MHRPLPPSSFFVSFFIFSFSDFEPFYSNASQNLCPQHRQWLYITNDSIQAIEPTDDDDADEERRRRRRAETFTMLSSLKIMRMAGGKGPAVEVTVPAHFRCPISLDVMKDPVTLCTGITYDRQSIEAWLESGNRTCPVTNQLLRSSEMIPNHAIRKMIQAWCVENRSKGVERIPTPKVPVSAMEAEQMVLGLGRVGRKEVARKMERLCRESERNRRCIAAAGAGFALAKAFVECSELEVQEEVLQVLTMMLPLDAEAMSVLGSTSSFKTLVRTLQSADLGRRRNSVGGLYTMV